MLLSPPGPRPSIGFVFIAQTHQMLHALPTAVELSRLGGFDVHVAGATPAHLAEARRLEAALGGGRIRHHLLWTGPQALRAGRSIPPKLPTLALNLPLLSRFDALVTPERTSLALKPLLRRTLFVHTDHGAGDRAVGYERRISRFDFVLTAGEKQRRRMRAARLVREGAHAIVGYPKFDMADALPGRKPALFAQERPVVLYNPHFHARLSSWPRFGLAVLEAFAASDRYNLIFAPHVRLFDGASEGQRQALAAFAAAPNIHVDLGSPASCDMTYTDMADVYLGDVSSQAYEFIRRPRPCLFLDANRTPWRGDEDYAHWRLGPVSEGVEALVEQVDAAVASHPLYAPIQRQAFDETFDLNGRSSERAAAAIAAFLAAKLPRRGRVLGGPLAWAPAE